MTRVTRDESVLAAPGGPTAVPNVLLLDETAEKVDLAGDDSIDVILRRPHGPSDGLGEDIEGNLLPRNATPKSAWDFFSGLGRKEHIRSWRSATLPNARATHAELGS